LAPYLQSEAGQGYPLRFSLRVFLSPAPA